ncbi:MAG: nucleotide-binding universal stress UspA family protein [Cocleimonas sp.]|jgi:nucleotide-binding universal stress UspA family protein
MGVSLASMKPIYAKSDNEEIIVRMSYKQAHKYADEFVSAGKNAGITVKAQVIDGNSNVSAKKMSHYSRNTDLVILAQPDPSKDNFQRLQDFSQDVILLSGRPVLFIPYIGISKLGFKKAMIAWDGTPAASRSLHDAIPLLAATDETTILIVESKKQLEFKRDLLVEGLVEHLSHHNINASIKKVRPGNNNVATTILNQIVENGIDLLVIGGYGTPTLKQKIFGGVSATLLSSMSVPVLMSH